MSDLTSERLAESRRIAEAAKNRLRRQPGQLHSRLEAEGAIDKLLAEIERLRRERDAVLYIAGRNDIPDKSKVEGIRLIFGGKGGGGDE